MNFYSLATLGIMAMTLNNVVAPIDSNDYKEEIANNKSETRASTSISSYRVENVTDEGFDFVISFNSNTEIYGIGLSYWKNGNYGGMKIHSKVEKIAYNQFKAHIKMKDIGSGTEYVYVGIQPVSANSEPYLGDIALKLDTTNPNLSLSLSNTNWTNQNIILNSTSKDDMNIIEKINFTDKDGNSNIEPLYSNPKVLLVKGFSSSVVEDHMKSILNNLTIVSAGNITSTSQLKGYDVVIYDGRYWNISDSLVPILNQAFEEGISLITNFNDDYKTLSIGNGNSSAVQNKGYLFDENVWDDGNLNGRVNRFAYLMNGKRESDEQYYKIGAGNSVFTISNVRNDDGKTTPGVLMKTHSNGNKWIHFQASDVAVSSGAMRRGIDEIMAGTMKARQTYNKSYEISSNGLYAVEVEDFSGNKTRKTINVTNIDKVAPTMNITGNPTSWTKSDTLTITASDNASGVKQIVLPNGNIVNGAKATFTTTKNGNYTFKVIDNAGNEYSKTVEVNKIDTSINNINILSSNMEMINSDTSERNLTIKYDDIIDEQSGLKGYSYVIDKVPNTIPDDIVDTKGNWISKRISDNGVYYLHIRAIDNAGNVSSVVHHKIDIPYLNAQAKPNENMVRLDWNLNSSVNKTFKIYQKKDGSNEFQSIGATNFEKAKEVKVLNVYPSHSTLETYTTWKGEKVTLPISASLKRWMEEPNSENSKGYGKGLISVNTVLIDDFNSKPDTYLKNSDGSYKYDVIMFGTLDGNGKRDLSNLSLEATKSFIDSGKGVLFGHDTVTQWDERANFPKLEEYVKIKTYGFKGKVTSDNITSMWNMPWSGGTEVNITKKGSLINYPWKIGEIGTTLNIPYTHTNSQVAKGDVWMKFINPHSDIPSNVVVDTNEYSDNGEGTNMAYLTSYNNTAMIQTGHAINRYAITTDEQKVLANTLFYLNQLSSDTFLDDYSGQDIQAPNKITSINHSFSGNKGVNINFNKVDDNGSKYEYYIESNEVDADNSTYSNVQRVEVKTGLKGYSYVIDTKPDTIPNDVVNTKTETLNITAPSNSFYIHIKAVDNANNAGETLHYKIEDLSKPTLNITGNPTNWTKNNVVLNINATDTGSGIQEIILPNGNKITSSNTSYTVSENGSYTFKVIDKFGNETVKTIVVDKIDKILNGITNIKTTMEMINTKTSERKITIDFDDITDTLSGLKGYSYVIDKLPSTVPDNTIETTNSIINKNTTDDGLYYAHIKAMDNAGNERLEHIKLDIPVLSAKVNAKDNNIRLDWKLDNPNDKTFKVYQKKEGSDEFQTISTTNLDKNTQVKVLNIYPFNLTGNAPTPEGSNITFKTWDGENMTLPKSASLKMWMETPNSLDPKGYGKGLIEVEPVKAQDFESNPDKYLKNSDGSWKYDVVAVGFWDSYAYSHLNPTSVKKLKEFANSGRGLLMGHDTVGYSNNFAELRDIMNIQLPGDSDIPFEYYDNTYVVSSTNIIKNRQGLLNNYPWNITQDRLIIPNAHSNKQWSYGDVWFNFDKTIPPQNIAYGNIEYNGKSGNGTNTAYLSSWGNTAMIQTGHSNGNATSDEQKLLANTLFYLNQLSSENYLNDNSGQDLKAPNKPSIYEHKFLDNGEVELNFNESQDNGSLYEYYVESEDTKANTKLLSKVSKVEIKSGVKGYSYVFDSNSDTIPDDTIETDTAKTIKVKNSNQNLYVHIKAIDNANNSSETLHYKISDITKPTLELTLNTSSWTNGNVTINAKAMDTESGIKSIILPNGNVINSTTASYSVSSNGIYYFKAIDRMGNQTISSITVSNIDKKNPTVTIQNNTNWTNKDVEVIITGMDE